MEVAMKWLIFFGFAALAVIGFGYLIITDAPILYELGLTTPPPSDVEVKGDEQSDLAQIISLAGGIVGLFGGIASLIDKLLDIRRKTAGVGG
jgi:hypothetical protein